MYIGGGEGGDDTNKFVDPSQETKYCGQTLE